VAYGARQTIEERVCGKPPQVVVGKAIFGRNGKRRILHSSFLPYPCPYGLYALDVRTGEEISSFANFLGRDETGG